MALRPSTTQAALAVASLSLAPGLYWTSTSSPLSSLANYTASSGIPDFSLSSLCASPSALARLQLENDALREALEAAEAHASSRRILWALLDVAVGCLLPYVCALTVRLLRLARSDKARRRPQEEKAAASGERTHYPGVRSLKDAFEKAHAVELAMEMTPAATRKLNSTAATAAAPSTPLRATPSATTDTTTPEERKVLPAPGGTTPGGATRSAPPTLERVCTASSSTSSSRWLSVEAVAAERAQAVRRAVALAESAARREMHTLEEQMNELKGQIEPLITFWMQEREQDGVREQHVQALAAVAHEMEQGIKGGGDAPEIMGSSKQSPNSVMTAMMPASCYAAAPYAATPVVTGRDSPSDGDGDSVMAWEQIGAIGPAVASAAQSPPLGVGPTTPSTLPRPQQPGQAIQHCAAPAADLYPVSAPGAQGSPRVPTRAYSSDAAQPLAVITPRSASCYIPPTWSLAGGRPTENLPPSTPTIGVPLRRRTSSWFRRANKALRT